MIRFQVLGTPASQGSKSISRSGRVYDSDPKLKAWRKLVAAEARKCLPTVPFDCPVSVAMQFHYDRPKTRKWDVWKTSSPDIDKAARAVLDALTMSGMIVDDSRVVELTARKFFAFAEDPWTGVWVTVTPLAHVTRR